MVFLIENILPKDLFNVHILNSFTKFKIICFFKKYVNPIQNNYTFSFSSWTEDSSIIESKMLTGISNLNILCVSVLHVK